MVKTMTPWDCRLYCDINPQFIREALKAERLDIGIAYQGKTGRWNYAIIPSKFFSWIGKPVPKEWRDDDEENS